MLYFLIRKMIENTEIHDLTSEEFTELIDETFEHLEQGRYRMALTSAKKVYEEFPEDYKSSMCLAWALMENGNSADALELVNLSVKLSGNDITARTYRGYLLTRMSLFEGALSDLNYVIKNGTPLSGLAVKSNARVLAALGRFKEAEELLTTELKSNPDLADSFTYLLSLLRLAELNTDTGQVGKSMLDTAEKAFRYKEYWFSLFTAQQMQKSMILKDHHRKALFLEIDSLFQMFRLRDALLRAESVKESYINDADFNRIYDKLLKSNSEGKIMSPVETKELKGHTDIVLYPGTIYKVFTAKTYNLLDHLNNEKRIPLLQFNEETIKYIGVEVVINNPFFKKRNIDIDGMAVWYLNNTEVGRNRFILSLEKDWKIVEFVQNWGTSSEGFWTKGQGQVDIYLEDKIICSRYFLIGGTQIINFEKDKDSDKDEAIIKFTSQTEDFNKYTAQSGNSATVESLFGEIKKLAGINEVKTSLRDFIDYLGFINERRKSGLNSTERFSLNCIFSGNPGTGKTFVARQLGEIFKKMNILSKGHLIQVDRADLVGQYVGETAQKTLGIIEKAKGGILFIREAHTLIREEKEDFGKEAVEVLLKRMDDEASDFVVIASGYPKGIENFLHSNPGLKSRFNHIFNFEDLNPDELIKVFRTSAENEDYIVTKDAEDLIKKEFIELYRKRDETFGNARLVKNYFNEIKIQLGKRYLKIPTYNRTREAMCTIYPDDAAAILNNKKSETYSLGIDEELLRKSLEELSMLTGLDSVKKEINEMVKLARFYIEQSENPASKFRSHFVFLGNPGTGKTTVARLFSHIYCALGILPKGHLVETDRQGLVGVYVGQTAQKTTAMINKSIGGTLFIDEAYTLNRKGSAPANDFGTEAIETLLKRMEDDRGEYLVIAAGYTDQMNLFLESNPGLQSRFTKKIVFDDLSPEELLEITVNQLKQKSHTITEEAAENLQKYYNRIFRERDNNFGNARIVRDLVETVLKNHLLRIADIPLENRTEAKLREISIEDLEAVTSKATHKANPRVQGDSQLLDEYLAELSELAGLESVKNSVHRLVSSLKVAKLREEKGLKVIPKNLHSVFTGNPGTGKTTIARLLSKIYKEMGIIEKGHLVEVDRSGLVAGYQGQTAMKTDAVIQRALGGTLFIDEAYSLARGTNDFGLEAIDTLIKRMEDHQGKFVVIVAGYTSEMKEFIDSNPGFKSRFTNFYNFEDYTPRQLLEIALVITGRNGYKPDEGAWQLLLDIFTEFYRKRDKSFGNARMVRNILYKAISNQEERILTLYNPDTEDLCSITYDDVASIDLNEL